MSCECNGEGKSEQVKAVLLKYKKEKSNLIQVLNEVQEKYGYIPVFAQEEVSKYLDIPMAEIYGVITFYSRFTLEPKGEYKIAVCLGTACFVKGSEKILETFKKELGIESGQTTEDGKFSLEETRCVGSCGLAPVFTVNDEVYGRATPEIVKEVLDNLKNGYEGNP